MCNLHQCYTFCTSVTLFALVLHLNCTALSQSESSNFFSCILLGLLTVDGRDQKKGTLPCSPVTEVLHDKWGSLRMLTQSPIVFCLDFNPRSEKLSACHKRERERERERMYWRNQSLNKLFIIYYQRHWLYCNTLATEKYWRQSLNFRVQTLL